MPNRERKRVPDDRSDILTGSLPKSPPAHPWDTENPSIRLNEENEKENRDEATRRGISPKSTFENKPAHITLQSDFLLTRQAWQIFL